MERTGTNGWSESEVAFIQWVHVSLCFSQNVNAGGTDGVRNLLASAASSPDVFIYSCMPKNDNAGGISKKCFIESMLMFDRFLTLDALMRDYTFPDEVLLEAMSSWPHIEHLQLGDSECDELANTVTFRGLFAGLLRLCPHLHTLRVSIDAANIDVDPKAEVFQHPTLHTLDLGLSRIRDAEVVASIIFSALPLTGKVESRKYTTTAWCGKKSTDTSNHLRRRDWRAHEFEVEVEASMIPSTPAEFSFFRLGSR
jgi:hypothetical protein